MKRVLYINLLSCSDSEVYGVNKFCASILHFIDNLEESFDVVVFCSEFFDFPANDILLSERTKVIRFPTYRLRVLRIAIEQIILPLYGLFRPGIFVSFNNVVPLLFPYPCVNTVHDVLPWRDNKNFSFINNLYLRLFTILSIRKCFKTLTVSEYSRNQIISFLRVDSEKIRVVYNSLPSNHRDASAPAAKKFVTVISKLLPDKRIDKAIRAFALLKTRGVASDLNMMVVGGDGGELANLKKVAAELGVMDKVVFCGYVNETKKRNILLTSKVLVSLGKEEGFSIPVLEAISLGVPVVAARDGAQMEVAGEGGVSCDGEDAVDIADSIMTVLSAQRSLSIKARARSKMFSRDIQFDRFLTVIGSIPSVVSGDA